MPPFWVEGIISRLFHLFPKWAPFNISQPCTMTTELGLGAPVSIRIFVVAEFRCARGRRRGGRKALLKSNEKGVEGEAGGWTDADATAMILAPRRIGSTAAVFFDLYNRCRCEGRLDMNRTSDSWSCEGCCLVQYLASRPATLRSFFETERE